MRSFFAGLTIIFIVIGLVFPIAWIGAIISVLCAVGASPGGLRPDGKPRTGGLLGGWMDQRELARTMKKCPACKSLIPIDATRCRHCTEILTETMPESQPSHEKVCFKCGTRNRLEDWTCINCGAPLTYPIKD